jgi:hypothetical protein
MIDFKIIGIPECWVCRFYFHMKLLTQPKTVLHTRYVVLVILIFYFF